MKKYIKNIFFLVLMVLAFMLPSFSRVKVIPEVSANLFDEDVLDLTYKDIVKKIIKHNSEFVFITLKGEIFRWNPENKMVNFLYNLNTAIKPGIFHQGSYVILEQQEKGAYIIFDLDEMKEAGRPKNLNIKKIVGLDRERLIYLAGSGKLTFFNYRTLSPLKTLEPGGKNIYNCEFKEGKILILSDVSLCFYDKQGNNVKTLKLKHNAVSDFLSDGRWIYYGSDKRELIKFSLTSGKTRWRFKIARKLKIKPLKIGPYISIIPEDNNIYFFNKNGTLYWWEKLDSARLLPPAAMKENVAVFLWNKKVKFFNYKKKRITTYPLNRPVISNPVNIGEYIYIVSEDDIGGETPGEGKPAYKRVSKIGNYYAVKIKTNPEYVKPVGKSITFNLKKINLIKPQYRVKIFSTADQQGSSGNGTGVFDKVITIKDKPSFIWIPGDAVEYRLVIEINARNKKELKIEETFVAVDIDRMLQNYYYNIQKQCYTGLLE